MYIVLLFDRKAYLREPPVVTSTAPWPLFSRTRRCVYGPSIRLQRVYRPSTQDQGVFIGVPFVLISILFELRAAIHLDDNAEDEGSVALQEPPSPDRCPILPERDLFIDNLLVLVWNHVFESILCSRIERDFFIDNLLVRIHSVIVMIRWTGLAPWEFEFPFPGSFISTFLGPDHSMVNKGISLFSSLTSEWGEN